MSGYVMECCRCGLQHRMDFRITDERGLEMRGYRIEGGESDMADKFIGNPDRPRAAFQKDATRLTSADVNVEGKRPEPKPPGERVIGDPDRPRAPFQKPATRIVPGG